MAETPAEEISRLRAEIANFKSNLRPEQEMLAAGKKQLEVERKDFEEQVKTVKEFMRAFNALNNAILSGKVL